MKQKPLQLEVTKVRSELKCAKVNRVTEVYLQLYEL